MPGSDNFESYAKRYLRRLAKDATPWARDNLVLAATMAIAPLLVLGWFDGRHVVDWKAADVAATLYGLAFLLYLAFHLPRTAWKLDQARHGESSAARADCREFSLQIERLRLEAEETKPRLEVKIFEVLFTEESYPRDVFVNIQLSNLRANSRCTIGAFVLKLKVADIEYSVSGVRSDLGSFRIFNEPLGRVGEVTHESLRDDVAAEITHQTPLQYGAPRRGWLHFRFDDAPPLIPMFCLANSVELEVWDPFEGVVVQTYPAAYSTRRRVVPFHPGIAII